jgi:hypothetical protein
MPAPPLDWAAVARFRAVRRERFERGILPTECDRKFFEQHRRRFYHVRPATVSDHWLFRVAGVSPKGFLAIVHRPSAATLVCAIDEDNFGPWQDSDAYAGLRWDHRDDGLAVA